MIKSQKVTFQKSHNLLAENLRERPPIQNIAIQWTSKAGYVNAVLAIVRTELRAREASSFCDFEKWPLAISPYSILFRLKQTYF